MNYLVKIIKGVMIGIANVIPGVSGGTMMVSMGIYNDVISSITGLPKHPVKSIKTLLPYILGMGVGIVGLSFVIGYLFTNYPFQTAMAFIGLIVGGLPIVFGKVKANRFGFGNGIVFLLFFLAIIGMEFAGEGKEVVLNASIGQMLILLLVGVIASATMVIPGVSGSLVLMLLGFYYPVIQTIKDFVSSAVRFEWSEILRCLAVLIPFGVGVALGIFGVAKLIELLLEKYEGITYSAILGLVVASPVVVILQNDFKSDDFNFIVIATGVVALGIGIVVSAVLGKE